MEGPKKDAQAGTDAHRDIQYAIDRARAHGMDDEAEAFERLMAHEDSRKRTDEVVIVGSREAMGLGAAMALAAGLGGPFRDRSHDTFTPMPRNIPRGAVKIAPGVWARDPKNKPKPKFKGSKAAKKASRRR